MNVLRYYKCFAFGHMMKEYNVENRRNKCGENDHLKEKCKSACLCRRLKGRKCDYWILSAECPEYVRMLEREKMQISDDQG